jgi:hypothetical protein
MTTRIETEDVERFIAAFNLADEDGFTPEIEQELMDTFPAIERLREENARLRDALEPFSRCPGRGKTGDRFVIAKAIYENDDYTPREAHWHWDDFEKARAALTPSADDDK